VPHPRRPIAFPVRFDPAFFAEDLTRARAAGRRVAQASRQQLERDGVDMSLLARCEGEHRDGTDLAG